MPFAETVFGRWMIAAGQAAHGEETPCPSCQEGQVRTQYIGDLAARVGYMVAWCPVCLRGFHGCRVRIPDDASNVLSFDDAMPEELRKRLPKK